MTPGIHTEHTVEELCVAGVDLYRHALQEGKLSHRDIAAAPCLLEFGMLQQDADEAQWLRPVAPSVVLPRLLRSFEEGIALQRRREARLADVFEPLIALDAQIMPGTDPLAITALKGPEQINASIAEAAAKATREALAIQPGVRAGSAMTAFLPIEQRLLAAGGRMRTLYQHTQRHSLIVRSHFEQLHGDFEVRTLDEVTERLIVLDRTVAFIPATSDRTTALEIRHPALIGFLVTAFERLWRLASPMLPNPETAPSVGGITPRQRAIAALLIEGHTDAVIADRLGLNIRTAREHIAKLAATLGSESRAQLGFLIGRSGILDQES